MSNYMQIKADIEALDKQREEMLRGAEAARVAELEAECVDIKKRIIAFGIQPHMIFSPHELKGGKRRVSAGRKYPVKFKHAGHEWSGTGAMPTWYAEAVRGGVTPEQMLVPGMKLGKLPKGQALLGGNGAAP